MALKTSTHPWIIGSLAIYAPSLHLAREAYQLVAASHRNHAFGTVTLTTGDDVDWVDMRFGTIREDSECSRYQDGVLQDPGRGYSTLQQQQA